MPDNNIDINNNTQNQKENQNEECSICFETLDINSFSTLPCCGLDGREETSTIKVCNGCLIILSTPTSSNDSRNEINTRIGKCPRCRYWLSIKTMKDDVDGCEKVTTISKVDKAGKCQICCQIKEHLIQNPITNENSTRQQLSCCDACFFGMRYSLVYECRTCHSHQRIPHPMYRYQNNLNEFSNDTWACHRSCGTYTNWRILGSEVRKIPLSDIPDSWGHDYLQLARSRVLEERANSSAAGYLGSYCNIS